MRFFSHQPPPAVSARQGINLKPFLCCVAINALKKLLAPPLAERKSTTGCSSQPAIESTLGPEGLIREGCRILRSPYPVPGFYGGRTRPPLHRPLQVSGSFSPARKVVMTRVPPPLKASW